MCVCLFGLYIYINEIIDKKLSCQLITLKHCNILGKIYQNNVIYNMHLNDCKCQQLTCILYMKRFVMFISTIETFKEYQRHTISLTNPQAPSGRKPSNWPND